ncbi:MAG: hypothetical protein ABIR55_10225 [Burkholderiaceae bacterium]
MFASRTALPPRTPKMVFKGTAVAQGTGRAVVTATGMRTEMGGIATLLATTPDAPTPLQVEIAHLGKVLGIALVVAAVVVAPADGQVNDLLEPRMTMSAAAARRARRTPARSRSVLLTTGTRVGGCTRVTCRPNPEVSSE